MALLEEKIGLSLAALVKQAPMTKLPAVLELFKTMPAP
jgi:hypothetical protein